MTVKPSNVLTPYQSEFVRNFLAEGSDRHQWLAAPAGSGSTQCALEIATRIIVENPSARVLILSGRQLLLQWMRRIEVADDPIKTIEGSRRNLRQISDEFATSMFSWPEGHIVVMDRWAIERFSDLEASVFTTQWALVVWDGFRAPVLSEKSGQFLERLCNTPNVERLLVLSHEIRPVVTVADSELPWMSKTIWDRSMLERSDGRAQRTNTEETTLPYSVTEAEKALNSDLEGFVEKWLPGLPHFSPLARLMSAAESSPLVLQEYLQRLHPSKSSIVLGQFDASEEADAPEITQVQRQAPRLADEVSTLQEMLDGLAVDSKLDALMTYLRDQPVPRSRTFIECRFATTARYLSSALTELSREVFLITADVPAKDKLRILSMFEDHGGILIATGAALQGVEISTDTVIPYDYVGSWMRNAFRPRIRGTEDGQSVKVIYLIDESRKRFQPALLGEF